MTIAGQSTPVQDSTGFSSTPENVSTWQRRSRGSKTPDLVDSAASSTKPEHTKPAAAHAGQAKSNLTTQDERQESTPMAHRSRLRRRARDGVSPGRTKRRRDAASNQAASPRKRTQAAAATDDGAGGPEQRQDEDILACSSSIASRARAKDDAGERPTRSSARFGAHTSSRPEAATRDRPTRPRSTRNTPNRGRLRHPRRPAGAKRDAEELAPTAKA